MVCGRGRPKEMVKQRRPAAPGGRRAAGYPLTLIGCYTRMTAESPARRGPRGFPGGAACPNACRRARPLSWPFSTFAQGLCPTRVSNSARRMCPVAAGVENCREVTRWRMRPDGARRSAQSTPFSAVRSIASRHSALSWTEPAYRSARRQPQRVDQVSRVVPQHTIDIHAGFREWRFDRPIRGIAARRSPIEPCASVSLFNTPRRTTPGDATARPPAGARSLRARRERGDAAVYPRS